MRRSGRNHAEDYRPQRLCKRAAVLAKNVIWQARALRARCTRCKRVQDEAFAHIPMGHTRDYKNGQRTVSTEDAGSEET